MPSVVADTAEIEYAVMLVILNFQTEFMQSHYTRAQVRLVEDLIEVTLTRTATIPAEDRLAQTAKGRTFLQQVNSSLFMAGESLLREWLEHRLRVKVRDLFSHLDVTAGTYTIIIRLVEVFKKQPIEIHP